MRINTKENLEKVLNKNQIEVVGWTNKDEYGFSRKYKFVVRGVEYVIDWWCNVSYLTTGECQIPFTDIEYSGTWPNSFRNNLVFKKAGEIVCVLPVEEYANELKKARNGNI